MTGSGHPDVGFRLFRQIAAFFFSRGFWPSLTLVVLVSVWGAYAVADGILALWAAVAARDGDTGTRWWVAWGGGVSILAGLVAFLYTGMTALVLLMFIAAWAIAIGAIMIWGAIELRKVLDDAWLLALDGVLSIAFGVILLARRGSAGIGLDDRLARGRFWRYPYCVRVPAEEVLAAGLSGRLRSKRKVGRP